MTRTLKRPMFRMGGSTNSGITSGLDQPRKQYSQGTDPQDRTFRPNIEQALEAARLSKDPRVNDILFPKSGSFSPGSGPGFLTSFGLDLMSRPSRGDGFSGLVATAADSAKEPFKTFQAANLARSGEKSKFARDLFEGDIQSQYSLEEERLDNLGKATQGGTEFEKERRVQMLNSLYDNKILKEEVELENASGESREKILANIETLRKEKEDYAKSILAGTMTQDDFVKDIIIAGVKNDVFDPAKVAEKYPELAGLLYDEMADGGRAGYNVGGQAMMPEVANAEEEQVEDLSYNELRSRLPQSIDNDIVQVIANSKQALLDFANIRDQQDVDQFNQRYNVSLNIAQEG